MFNELIKKQKVEINKLPENEMLVRKGSLLSDISYHLQGAEGDQKKELLAEVKLILEAIEHNGVD